MCLPSSTSANFLLALLLLSPAPLSSSPFPFSDSPAQAASSAPSSTPSSAPKPAVVEPRIVGPLLLGRLDLAQQLTLLSISCAPAALVAAAATTAPAVTPAVPTPTSAEAPAAITPAITSLPTTAAAAPQPALPGPFPPDAASLAVATVSSSSTAPALTDAPSPAGYLQISLPPPPPPPPLPPPLPPVLAPGASALPDAGASGTAKVEIVVEADDAGPPVPAAATSGSHRATKRLYKRTNLRAPIAATLPPLLDGGDTSGDGGTSVTDMASGLTLLHNPAPPPAPAPHPLLPISPAATPPCDVPSVCLSMAEVGVPSPTEPVLPVPPMPHEHIVPEDQKVPEAVPTQADVTEMISHIAPNGLYMM